MITFKDCVTYLRDLGLTDYSSVIVHHHPRADEILGQTATLISALLNVCSSGNVFSYALIDDNREPYTMGFASLEEVEVIRKQMTQFDIKRYRDIYYDPTFSALSKSKGRLFSNHPYVIGCVNGPQGRYIVRQQPLDFPFGVDSCFGPMMELQSKILFFEDDDNLDELRLAFSLSDEAKVVTRGAAVGGQWVQYLDYEFDSYDVKKVIDKCSSLKQVQFGSVTASTVDYQEAIREMRLLIEKKFIKK